MVRTIEITAGRLNIKVKLTVTFIMHRVTGSKTNGGTRDGEVKRKRMMEIGKREGEVG